MLSLFQDLLTAHSTPPCEPIIQLIFNDPTHG
jgi:hypothetical protein